MIPENEKKIPASFKFTAFPFKGLPFTVENIKNLELIRNCKNSKIYETSFIKFYIDLNWKAVKGWAVFYSILLFFNIFFFILMMKYGRSDPIIYVPFLVINFNLCVWELTQVFSTSIREHLSEIWNWIDLSMYFLILIYFLAEVFDFKSEYEEFVLGLMILIRGLTAFRVVDGTRYYVRLILTSLDSIKYFLIMFCYSSIFFSVLFTISQGREVSFDTLWDQGWSQNFGGEIEMEDTRNFVMTYMTGIVATVVNVVLMLNMLISILGDSYDNFSLERNIIDYTEKLEICLEIQKVLFWRKLSGSDIFLHVLPSPFEDDDGQQDWQGKIMYMEKKQERRLDNIHEKVTEVDAKLSTVEDNIKKNIEEVNQKVTGIEKSLRKEFENKLGNVNLKVNSIENKITSVQTNLSKVLDLLAK
jgi:hypothetical protein